MGESEYSDLPTLDSKDLKEKGDDEATLFHHASIESDTPTGQASKKRPAADSSKRVDAWQLEANSHFGDYEILSEIARGGMGVVYKARQISLNRIVALKMILAGQLASDDDVKRFYFEAESAAGLSHPGIVPIYEIGSFNGQHFFSMGYVDGPSLSSLLKEGPIAPRDAAECLARACEAIQYAHDHGVIHRDLKPGNILLATDQTRSDLSGSHTRQQPVSSKSKSLESNSPNFGFAPKVTDFGLAKQIHSSSELTGTGQVLGTPSYMPPEQAEGKISEIGIASDIYSLGAILYCMLTGRPPFQSTNPVDTLMQVLKSQPIAPRQLNPSIPRDLETICLKAIEKAPIKRYGSAMDLHGELKRYLNGDPILARPISKIERGFRWLRRHPEVGTITGVILAAIGTVVGATMSANRRLQLERDIAVHAKNDANSQRSLAEGRLDKAIEAVDKMMVRVAGERWTKLPELQEERRLVLEDAVTFYNGFLSENLEHAKVRNEAAKAQTRVAGAYLLLNELDKARSSSNTAISLYEGLIDEQPQNPEFRSSASEVRGFQASINALSGDYTKAQSDYLQAIAQAEAACKMDPDKSAYLLRFVEAQANYAYFCLSFDRVKGTEGLAILMPAARKLSALHSTGFAEQLGLAFALTVEGAYLLNGSDFKSARERYDEAATLLDQLKDWTPPSARLAEHHIYTRAIVTVQRGMVRGLGGHTVDEKQAGLQMMEEGKELFNRLLATNPKAFPFQLQKMQTLQGLGSLYRNLKDEPNAIRNESEAASILISLIRDNPNLEWLNGLDALRQSMQWVGAVREGNLDHFQAMGEEFMKNAVPRSKGDVTYNVACAYSLASKHDASQSDLFGAKAIELLESLRKQGYFDMRSRVSHLTKDADIDPIRERTDYKSFFESLQAK